MTPRAVTLDVAGTLVDVRWNPARVVEQAAGRCGLQVAPHSGNRYAHLYSERLAAFHAANRESDEAVREFWLALDADWLAACGHPPALARAVYDAGWDILFGADSTVFVAFPDAEPALRRLRAAGIALAAVSNWDNSLPVVLAMLGWTELFEVVVPSLVFGHEKPDRRIFDHALRRLGAEAATTMHIGDDRHDDLEGARAAGLRAALIDRNLDASQPPVIHTLDELETAFAWTA